MADDNGHDQLPPAGLLAFDARFKERPVAEQLEYLHKLAASQNNALDLMQKERNALRAQVVELQASLVNAEEAFQIQKNIVADLVTVSNETQQDAANSIHVLEDEVRSLRGE